jgi:hypothetical protein
MVPADVARPLYTCSVLFQIVNGFALFLTERFAQQFVSSPASAAEEDGVIAGGRLIGVLLAGNG